MQINRLFFMIMTMSPLIYSGIIFKTISEDSTINKNGFLCTSKAIAAQEGCNNAAQKAQGYDLAGGKTLILCNQQAYWLQQKAKYEFTLQVNQKYSGAQLTNKLVSEGWDAMGGYALVITTDPVVTAYIMPSVQIQPGKTKVIAQLWYSGAELVQLWSQDALVVSDGQMIQINVSSNMDTRLQSIDQEPTASMAVATNATGANTAKANPEVATTPVTDSSWTLATWKNNFLNQMGLEPSDRLANSYNGAIGSPRSVQIAIVTA